MNEVHVFTTKVSYIYYDGRDRAMRETPLKIQFIADSHGEALDVASRWADNRFEALMNTYGDDDSKNAIGSITVGVRTVGRARSDGYIDGGYGQFFEWKYDWPGTRQEWIERWKSTYPERASKPAGE